MTHRMTEGMLQPDGRVIPEATFDPKYIADSIVHIASLPNDVAVLEFNIMYLFSILLFYKRDVETCFQGGEGPVCWKRLIWMVISIKHILYNLSSAW